MSNLRAQCTLTTAVYVDTLVCGQCVNLYAFGQGQGQIVFSENFNSGQPTGWAFTNQAQFNNPCSPGGADGTAHLWMGNTSGVPRILRTVSYNFTTATAGVTICFDMLFAEQTGDPADAPCEGPDEPDEGVYLQYSTNNGTTWNTINYFDPNGGGDPQLINWNNWCFELPPAALTANCQIRWFQDNDSGQDYDHWGIDNVEIYFNDPTFNITWNHDGYSYGAGNSGGMNPTPVCPQNTTTYTATMTNGTTTCTSSVTVIVRDPDIVVNAGPDPASVCPGQCVSLNASNTRIIVSPAKTPTYFNGELSVLTGLPSAADLANILLPCLNFGGCTCPNGSTVPFLGTCPAIFTGTISMDINITDLNTTVIQNGQLTTVCIENVTMAAGNLSQFGISLTCPSGSTVNLVNAGTLSGTTISNMCFNLTSTTPVSGGSAPYTGNFQPAQPLTNLSGCTANGVWTLNFTGTFNLSSGTIPFGTLYGWTVSFNDPEISEPAIVSWSPTTGMTGANTLTPNVCPTATTTYTLTATDAAGCVSATDQVTVTVGSCGVPTPCNSSTGCFGNNLVTNGNFESFNPASPFATFTSNYDYSPCPGTICTNGATGAPILCQYDFSVQTSPNPCNSDWSSAIGDHTTGTGNMMIVDFPAGNVGANNKIWCQTINLAPATDYCFGAYFINILPAGSGQPQPVFGFTSNNTLLGSSNPLSENEQWQFMGMQFNSGAGGNTTLCITNQNFGGVGYDLAIDDISVRPVINGTPPDAVNDNVTLCPGQPSQVINVLSNDVAGAGGPITTLNIIAAPPFTDGDITNINLAAGTVTFTPLPGFTGSTTFTYQVCNASGCCDVATVALSPGTITPPAIPAASVCPGGSGTTLNAGNGYSSYVWSTGATTPGITVNPAATTTYTVTVTNTSGCTSSASVAVTVNTLTPPVVAPASSCTPGSPVPLNAGGGYTNYAWSTGANTQTINVSPVATTTYTVTVTGAGGCTASASTTVTVGALPPPVIPPSTSCQPGSAVTLNAGGGYTNYAWSTGATGQNITVTPAATTGYTVTVTASGGCTASASVAVTVSNISPPVMSLPSLCLGGVNPVTLDAGSPGPYTAYVWSTGATSQTITINPSVTTAYNVTVTNAAGCSTTSGTTVTVNSVNQPTVTSASICPGQTATLTALGSGFTSFTWSNGAGTQAVNVSPASTTAYTVTVSGAGGCTATANATVTVFSVTPPVIPPAEICSAGSSTILNAGAGYTGYAWSTGATAPSISVNPAATTTYTVTVTGAGGCTASSNVTVTVNNIIPPVLDPVSTCAGGNPVVLDAGAGYSGYTWSTGATTPTISVTPATTTSYTVTVTGAGGCTATATTLVTVNSATPPVFAPVNTCAGGIPAVLDAGLGYTGYLWSTGATTPTISVTPAATTGYTVTVTDAGGCTATSAVTVTVNSITPPVIPGAAICSGITTTLNAGSGYTGYLWSTGATSSSINVNPTAGTTYMVTVTGAGGCTATAGVTVAVNPNPTVNITGSTTFCAGGSTILNAGAGLGSYAWSNGANTATITVTAAGTYGVTVTDANTCTATAQVTVTQSTSLNPVIGGDITLCPGQTSTLDAGSGFNAYLWSDGSTSQTVDVSVAGAYSVTVSDAGGCSGTAAVVVASNPAPAVTISGNNSICAGATSALSATTGFTQYEWSTGAFGQNINATIAGTYSVTATDANGCTASDSFTLTVNPAATPAITGNLSICPGGSTVLDAGTGYLAYSWSNGSNGQTATANAAGAYSVTVTDANGCTGSTAATVTVNTVNTPVIGGNTTICPGSSTILSTSGFSAYNWSTGETTPSVSVSPAANTTYTVTVTNAAGCTASNSAIVNILTPPLPDIAGNAAICAGSTGTLNAGGGFAAYLWSNGASTSTISVTTAGTYSVTVSNAQGCTGSDSFAVAVNPLPVVTISGSTTFCAGGGTILNAGAGLGSYAWSNGANTATITVTAAGTYGVTVTNANGCTGSAQTTVAVSTSLNPNIVGDLTICPGENTTLDAGTGYASYIWSDGSTGQTLSAGTAGTYSVTVSDSGGCTGSVSAVVIANPNPVVNITGNLSFCTGGSTVLDAGGGYATYTWSNGDNT
ncbi:hypothetical protein BVG80_02140, partial [Sphingobacteriales bacterium TSM_CSM]